MLNSLKHKIKEWIYAIIPPPATNDSFSQAGEDCCIDFLFSQLKVRKPSYLELGVCTPKYASNTYKFYKKGSIGVLVEADKTLIDKIKQERKEDTILPFGVGVNEQEEADFYVFEVSAHNTFNKQEAEYRQKNGSFKLLRIEKVKLVPVNTILKNYFNGSYPDFLSIDIEGLDLAVLKSIDYEKYPIPVICAETCAYSENHIKPKDKSIEELMVSRDYFVYADTYINTIFVNKTWFHSAKQKK